MRRLRQALSTSLPFAVLGRVSPDSLPPCDVSAAERFQQDYYSAAFALRDKFALARVEVWWAQYPAYLASDEWRERSRVTIATAGGICEYCRCRRAVQAHHVCYDRVGCERPEDLRAVCLFCHRKEHSPDTPEHLTRRCSEPSPALTCSFRVVDSSRLQKRAPSGALADLESR